MNKIELLEKLDQSRADFLELLDSFSKEEMETFRLSNGWSIKDILVHLTLWEAELIKLLFHTHQGRIPQTVLNSQESDEKINARWYEQHKNRLLEQVLKDFDSIRDQTIHRVELFSDTDLSNPKRNKWLKNKPLWQWIVASTIEHEDEHAPELRLLLEKKEM